MSEKDIVASSSEPMATDTSRELPLRAALNPPLAQAEGSPDRVLMDIEEQRNQEQARFWLDYSQQLSGAIRYREALAAIERARNLDPASAEIWYAQGTYLAMVAEYESALAAFEHALELAPDFVPAWDGKAWALGILGHRAEALAAVNRALELNPDYFDAVKRKRRLDIL